MPKSVITVEQDIEIARLYLGGETAQDIADWLGTYKQPILNSLKRSHIPRRKNWSRASGDKHGHWKGGIRMIKGYKHILLPGHPLARADGYVAEHRLIKEKDIVNKLQVVHHEDGNRLNNKRSNLIVYKNNGVHRREHSKKESRDKKGRFIKLK